MSIVIPTDDDVQAMFVRTIGKTVKYGVLAEGEVATLRYSVMNATWEDIGQGVACLNIDDSVTLVRAILQVAIDDHLDGQKQRIQIQVNSLAIIFASGCYPFSIRAYCN